MTTTHATTIDRINYEVVWGPEEHERILYVDYGDGTFISETADVRATRKFLELIKAGTPVGFYKNGVLECGQDV